MDGAAVALGRPPFFWCEAVVEGRTHYFRKPSGLRNYDWGFRWWV
jgi:hypothetical protein